MKLRTFPVERFLDSDLPSGAWDDKWNDPAKAARAALDRYGALLCEVGAALEDRLLQPNELESFPKNKTEHRCFNLGEPLNLVVGGELFRGGGFGEIYRPYSFGRDKVFFHAQNLVFGVDATGFYFLEATVGRLHGGWGCDAALVARLVTAQGPIAGLQWRGDLDPPKDVRVRLAGRSERLASRFLELTEVSIDFYSYQHAGRR